MSDILAVAATTETAQVLIQTLVNDTVLGHSVPWTIVNKYYTADVTVHIHALASWEPTEDQLLAPAILFVWNKGEPYRDYIRTLVQHTSQREFEVALAVRLPAASSGEPESEDDQATDDYLSRKGFEFVDVPDIRASSSDRTGIPRIVDALSTIMWPSMVRHSSKRGTTPSFLGHASSDDYHDLVRLIGEKTSGNDADRIQRELEELEHWLDRDASPVGRDDDASPWSTAVTPGTLSPSLSGFLEHSRPTTPKPGFDDDFTCFVSASDSADISPVILSSPPRPSIVSERFSTTFSFNSPCSGCSTPISEDHTGFDVARLGLGESYKSLGSVSDLGDQDKETREIDSLSSGSDQDMPSHADILDTSRKIFGNMPLSLSPTQGKGDTWPTAGGSAPQNQSDEQVDVEMKDADLERFDLQGMLDTLQGLKEEISGMPDKERRNAAARVALCLAYGIGGSNPHP